MILIKGFDYGEISEKCLEYYDISREHYKFLIMNSETYDFILKHKEYGSKSYAYIRNYVFYLYNTDMTDIKIETELLIAINDNIEFGDIKFA